MQEQMDVYVYVYNYDSDISINVYRTFDDAIKAVKKTLLCTEIAEENAEAKKVFDFLSNNIQTISFFKPGWSLFIDRDKGSITSLLSEGYEDLSITVTKHTI